jgi:hypothetical protein
MSLINFRMKRRNYMVRIFFGVFIVLHSLVHLLYYGQSARYFELKPGMVWPDGSWVFSRLLGDGAVRNMASILLLLSAIGLIIGGIGILVSQAWWRPEVVCAAIFSSVIFILFWNGRMQNLDAQGGIGLIIDVAILMAVLVLRWPKLGF